MSIRQIKVILDETKSMGKMRLDSTDQEINRTSDLLKNVRENTSPSTTQPKGKTVVKKFVSPSTGKTKLIYSDGTEEIR